MCIIHCRKYNCYMYLIGKASAKPKVIPFIPSLICLQIQYSVIPCLLKTVRILPSEHSQCLNNCMFIDIERIPYYILYVSNHCIVDWYINTNVLFILKWKVYWEFQHNLRIVSGIVSLALISETCVVLSDVTSDTVALKALYWHTSETYWGGTKCYSALKALFLLSIRLGKKYSWNFAKYAV